MKQFNWFFYLFLVLSAPVLADTQSGAPDGRIEFIDLCSQRPTQVATPNGIGLLVTMKGLNLSQALKIKLTYSLLSSSSAEAIVQKTLTKQYEYQGKELSEAMALSFSLPCRRKLYRVQKQMPGSNIWEADMEWTQGLAVGKASAVISRIDGTDVFYKPLSNSIECVWESAPTLSSTYIYNADSSLMVLQRSVKTVSQIGMSNEPYILRDSPNKWPAGSSTPGNVPANVNISLGGFYYQGKWYKNYINQTVSIERDWPLLQEQGGVFADRYSFSRIKVARYEWLESDENKHQACAQYTKTAEGYLDVGLRTSDFYSVPRSLSGNSEAVAKFVESFRNTLNTCKRRNGPNVHDVRISAASRDELLIFNQP